MKTRLLWPVLALLLLLVGIAPEAYGQTGTWRARTPLTSPRSGMMTISHDGFIYVLGGRNGSGQVVDLVERLNPSTGSWESLPRLRKARENGAVVVYENQLMVIGGRTNENEVTHDVEVFNASENRWESFEGLNTAREGHAALFFGNQLYVLGGSNELGQILTSVEEIEDDDAEWDDSDWVLDVPRASFGAAVVDDVAYVVGGFNAFGPVGLLQRYTADGGTRELEPLAMPRGGLSATGLAGRLLVMGGRKANNEVVAQVDQYDPSTDSWTSLTSMTAAREAFASVNHNGEVYVLGGLNSAGAALATVESFTTATEPPATPFLTLPANNATGIEDGQLLAWSAPDAPLFDLQLATTPDFSTLLIDARNLSATTLSVDGLDAVTTYFWRVRARNAAGVSDWTSPFTFVTAEGVGVVDEVPARFFTLHPNWPNPFTHETTIPFEVGAEGREPLRLEVVDLRGRLLAVVAEGYYAPGAYEARWDGRDQSGSPMASGVYLYTLQQAGRRASGTLVLLK